MTQSPVELYKNGGVAEIYRGVRDWYRYHIYRPIAARLYSTGTLDVSGTSVSFIIENQESVSRTAGLSEMEVMEDIVAGV